MLYIPLNHSYKQTLRFNLEIKRPIDWVYWFRNKLTEKYHMVKNSKRTINQCIRISIFHRTYKKKTISKSRRTIIFMCKVVTIYEYDLVLIRDHSSFFYSFFFLYFPNWFDHISWCVFTLIILLWVPFHQIK